MFASPLIRLSPLNAVRLLAAVTFGVLALALAGAADPAPARQLTTEPPAPDPVPRPPASPPLATENPPAGSGLPEPEPPGLQSVAPIKSQCAAVLDAATGTYPFLKKPDKPCWTGSIAKAVTIDVALQAIKDGKLGPASTVQFSDDAVDEGCNCLGGYAANLGGIPAADYTIAGERMRLDDALAGTAMSAVEPTVGTAELTAQAVVHGSTAPAQSIAESQALRHEFVDLMNDRFAELGLTDSWFSNEHGGWEGLSGLPNPKSTPRDMVRFWLAAKDEHPLFLKSLGLRSKSVFTTAPGGGSKQYDFNKWYGYYPRVEGDKAGGVMPAGEPFWNSLLGSTRRLGRTLSWIVMQNDDDADPATADNAFDDSARVLAHAFGEIFEPEKRGDSANQASIVKDNALDCWGSSRCVTASDTSIDRIKLIVWEHDVNGKSVERLGAGEISQPGVDEVDVAHLGVAQVPAPGPTDITEGMPGPTLPSDGGRTRFGVGVGRTGYAAGGGVPTVSGKRIVVSAERRNDDVVLRSWKVTGGGGISALSNVTLPGEGDNVSVQRLNARRFVSAVRASNGKLRLRSWYVSNNGQFSQLDSATTGGAIDGAPALAPTGSPLGVATAVTLPTGRAKLIFWAVHKNSGAITRRGSTTSNGPVMSGLSLTRAGDAFMMAGIAGVKAQVHVYEPSNKGQSWTKLGDATEIEGTGVSEVSIETLKADAALLATRRHGKLALRVIDFDREYEQTWHKERHHVIASASAGTARLLDVERLNDKGDAAGDFAIALRTGAGSLRVGNWRVGEKP